MASKDSMGRAYGKSRRNAQGDTVSAHRMQVLEFWLTDDGWNGSCEQPSITVQAGSFEHAKSEIELALGKYVESLLREPERTSTGQAA
jgi:predicted RNase H-like HicB family nuclease